MMTNQVTLLHSQLLFERNQCLQHAARNRRLLSMLHKSGADKEDLLAMVRRWFVVELLSYCCIASCREIRCTSWSKRLRARTST